jgi:hypothetical protein
MTVPREDEYDPEEYESERSPSVEMPTEYMRWRSEPSAIKRGFEHVTKDLVLSNLSEEDLAKIRMCFDLYMQNQALVDDDIIPESEIKVANGFLESMVATICNSSVGFKGFGRSLDTTVIQLKEIKRAELKKERNWGFRRQQHG